MRPVLKNILIICAVVMSGIAIVLINLLCLYIDIFPQFVPKLDIFPNALLYTILEMLIVFVGYNAVRLGYNMSLACVH